MPAQAPDTIDCDVHGPQDRALVCAHIAETLADGEPRGFVWNVVEGGYEAICEACNALSEEAFAAAADGLITLVCFGCFQDAAEINGAVIA